jgi:hypothetical protein
MDIKRFADIMTSSTSALPPHPSSSTSADDGNEIHTRRQFLKSIALGLATIGLWPTLSRSQTDSQKDRPQEFRWQVPSAHFETVRQELHFEGKIEKNQDAKGLPLVYIFVGTVLLPYLAKAILALRRDIVHGGVVIDTRGKKIEIDTDKGLPGGVIVVVTPNGTQLFQRDEIGNPSALVDVLLKAK